MPANGSRGESLQYCKKNCRYISEQTAPVFCKECGGLTDHVVFVMPGNEGRTYPHYWCAECHPSLLDGRDETQ